MSRDPINSFDDNFSDESSPGPNPENRVLRERVADISSRVRGRAGHAVETLSEKFGHERQRAAINLDKAASSLHDRAGSIPGGPKVVNLTHRVATGMESAATYLRDHDFDQMGADGLNFARRYPAQTLLGALFVGFLAGRRRR
jgi:hypothetical protein